MCVCSQTIPMEHEWLPSFSEGVRTACDQSLAAIIETLSLQLKLHFGIRLANIMCFTKARETARLWKTHFFNLCLDAGWKGKRFDEKCLPVQICNWPPDPADELCSLIGRSIHRKQQQISHHCSLLTSTNPLLAPCLWVKMIAIQNQSRGVTCASARPFLYLRGNNMHRLRIKKFNDESDFHWCRWGAIDQPGSRNELGRADLHGSWQQGGHIQSHLTHSALTFDPWQCLPRVNSHPPGSIALDRRLEPLAAALGPMEGAHRAVEVGCRLEEDDLKGQGHWPMMMWEIYTEIGPDEGRGTLERICKFSSHQSTAI